MRTLVVVSGPAASGKSTLAVPLAERLGLALLAKDVVKEALFDALGSDSPGGRDADGSGSGADTEWSKRLGAATYAVLWALAPKIPAVVMEANFGAADAPKLRALCERPIQVHCTAPAAEREQRFEDRERHPGHVDDTYPDRQDQAEPLDLGGPTLVVDTTHDPDLDAVVAWVRNEIR